MRVYTGLVALLCSAGAACSTASQASHALNVRPSSPFTQADAQLFDDGVDLIGDPEALTGRWADEWSLEMQQRVQRSDFIALVSIDTLRTHISPQQRTTHSLLAQVDEVIEGQLATSELSLQSSDDARGFESVDRERTRVLRRPLLLLGKWAADADGQVRARWHLALATQQVVQAVRALLGTAPPNAGAIER